MHQTGFKKILLYTHMDFFFRTHGMGYLIFLFFFSYVVFPLVWIPLDTPVFLHSIFDTNVFEIVVYEFFNVCLFILVIIIFLSVSFYLLCFLIWTALSPPDADTDAMPAVILWFFFLL
jgi:hypothetical protein